MMTNMPLSARSHHQLVCLIRAVLGGAREDNAHVQGCARDDIGPTVEHGHPRP